MPEEPRRIEVDIGAAMEALQSSPELCAAMNELVGGPALVEAQAEVERLRAENTRLQGIIENMREIRTTRALGFEP